MDNNKDISALETIEELINYNSYVFKKIIKHLVPGKSLDFGCGFGGFIKFTKNYKLLNFIGHDVNDIALSKLKTDNIDYLESLNSSVNSFENVVSINVLEHIQNDQDTIHNLHKLLKPNGRLILYLPQSHLLWTELDNSVGHVRRYSKKMISDKLNKSGFEILHTEYVDFVGAIVILLAKYLKINLKYKKNTVIFYDKTVFKIFKYLDYLFKKIYGKNILVVARAK